MDMPSPHDANINSPIGHSPVRKQAHPNVWLLMGHKAGDNTQVLALAEALGWPYEIKRFVYKKTELLSNLLLGPTLAGIRKSASTRMMPPWPDLLITAGRRNEPIARWIQKQSNHSTRIVHIGRPWAQPACFDLIVTTPQYQIPSAPNILCNTLPLHRITKERLAQAAEKWQARLAHLPRPYLAMFVGGNSGVHTLDPATAERLGREANAMAESMGGSLLITSSARTPAAAFAILRDTIHAPASIFEWQPDSKDNPYFSYLGLADAFIVTGESISMLTEACITRKPVYIFDLVEHPVSLPTSSSKQKEQRPWWLRMESYHWKPLTHRLAMGIGPPRMRRNIRIMHQDLIDAGRAVWLGQIFSTDSIPPPLNELERTAARIQLFFTQEDG